MMSAGERQHAGVREENTGEPNQKQGSSSATESSMRFHAKDGSADGIADWLHLLELLEPFLSIGRAGVGVVHNLNGFLAGLIGHIEVMKMKRPELDSELDNILGLARKLRDGIGEISTKLDNELTREPQPQNINQIIRAELSFLRADLYFKHSVKVSLDLQESLPNVYGFYADFSLALEDVLLNAIDAQRDNPTGWIRLQTRVEGNRIQIEIDDGGSGFNENDLARSFNPMPEEVVMNEDRSVRGHLGLALAKQRLERWGGTISLENHAEGGGRVLISLPRREKVPVR